MFTVSPFDMMMYQPSHVYHQRPVYVQSPYQRYARPSQQHVYVEDAEDELAEYVARVRAAEQARLDAERQLAYQQQQLAQAKKIAYLRVVEQERKQREAEQVAYYQAVRAERQRRQKLHEQQMKLRDAELKRRYEEQQRELQRRYEEQQRLVQQRQQQPTEQENKDDDAEEQLKLDIISQLFGEMFGQRLSRPVGRQSMNKHPAEPVQQQVKPSIKEAEHVKQSAASPSKADVKAESPFFIPVRVINSSEPSQKQTVQSPAPSRVSIPLTINTAPSSPVEIEDEPITPEQWNLDASDVFKADRVLTPSPSEPASPKQQSVSDDVSVESSNDRSVNESSELSVSSTKDQQNHSAAPVDQRSPKQADAGVEQTVEQVTSQSVSQPDDAAQSTENRSQSNLAVLSTTNELEVADKHDSSQQPRDQLKVEQSNADCEWEKVESH